MKFRATAAAWFSTFLENALSRGRLAMPHYPAPTHPGAMAVDFKLRHYRILEDLYLCDSYAVHLQSVSPILGNAGRLKPPKSGVTGPNSVLLSVSYEDCASLALNLIRGRVPGSPPPLEMWAITGVRVSIAVWAKPSSTTVGMYSSTGPITPLPICAAASDLSGGLRLAGKGAIRIEVGMLTGGVGDPQSRP